MAITDSQTFTILSSLPEQATLTMTSTPINVMIRVQGQGRDFQQITPWSIPFDAGSYIVTAPSPVQVNSQTYYFQKWENGSTNPTRTINLSADMALEATYATEKPPFDWRILAVLGIVSVIIVAGVVAYKT